MSINQRQHIRFSLDIKAFICLKYGERRETRLQQISIGGCFADWEENIYVGDEFRMEIELPNRNFLPLHCKALYLVDRTGIGIKFVDICKFEQELVASIIANKLEQEGVPLHVDPFMVPPTFVEADPSPRITDLREKHDAALARIMTADE